MRSAKGRLAGISAALLCGGGEAANPAPIAALLDELFEELLLVGGEPPAAVPGRRVADPPGPPSPLRGLLGALDAASGGRVLAVGADQGALSAALVLALVAAPESDAVVPRTKRGLEPMCAVYRREPARALARARLEAGRLALHELLDELEVWHLAGDDLACIEASSPERGRPA